MEELKQWLVNLGVMAFIGLIIVWDHKVTKREEKARKKKKAEEDEWYYF